MLTCILRLCLTFFVPYVTTQETFVNNSFRTEKLLHSPGEFNNTQLSRIAGMTNTTHIDEILDKICIPRVVGTAGHEEVKNYLKNFMSNLGWSVESDIFDAATPNLGTLKFENIIAKLNPNARRYLVLACHYDSKYFKKEVFVGATDSAVPCAQILNLATVMKEELNSAKTNNVSLMFIFFDGEEAFKKWDATDSIYGARHLANKWKKTKSTYGYESNITDLDKIDILVLLDLLGGLNPTFYNYFENTERWYRVLVNAEESLAKLRKFEKYEYDRQDFWPQPVYFRTHPNLINFHVEDDHIPFLNENVPIIHLIPYGFPSFWHTPGDNREVIDMATTENLNKILRVFVASYLNLNI